MHRVDTEGHVGGQWQDGNPQIGQQGTVMSAAWLNDIQENVARVIVWAGMGLVKGNFNQLQQAIQSLINQSAASVISTLTPALRVPVGAVFQMDGPIVPAGYLALDGGNYLRASYPDLVAWYQGQGRLIAGTTGAHFRTPNYMGRFARAWSADALVDPDGPRDPGSLQADEFKQHAHSLPVADNANSGNNVEDADAGGLKSGTTGQTGGDETRPKNVAFMWCVKA